MFDLSPLETLFDDGLGYDIPLAGTLSRFYGKLKFPAGMSRPYVISNFVSTVDGVVTLGITGKAGGNAISGNNRHDAAVMGILRAVADVIIIGSKNLAASPRHIWTPGRVFPDLAEEYAELRRSMGIEQTPLNVIVTANPKIDWTLPIFQSGTVKVLTVSTSAGAKLIPSEKLPEWVRVDAAGGGPRLTAKQILNAVMRARPESKIILLEGGPNLMGTFFAEKALDELFLTLSPQVAGRGDSPERLGLVAGRTLAPDNPAWGRIAAIKKFGDHFCFSVTPLMADRSYILQGGVPDGNDGLFILDEIVLSMGKHGEMHSRPGHKEVKTAGRSVSAVSFTELADHNLKELQRAIEEGKTWEMRLKEYPLSTALQDFAAYHAEVIALFKEWCSANGIPFPD